jgi:hypothetical protein
MPERLAYVIVEPCLKLRLAHLSDGSGAFVSAALQDHWLAAACVLNLVDLKQQVHWMCCWMPEIMQQTVLDGYDCECAIASHTNMHCMLIVLLALTS